MSKFSPGPIATPESLARFVFSPMHINAKTKKPKPSLFSHAETKGCSVQRDDLARLAELRFFSLTVMNKPEPVWLGVVRAQCGAVRALRVDGEPGQVACVYDTGQDGNPAHAEICWNASAPVDEYSGPELRKLLMDVFDIDHMVTPQEYRNGVLWEALPTAIRERKPS